MKIGNLICATLVLVGSAYFVTGVLPAIAENNRYREGLKELDRARSKLSRIKNQLLDSKEEALRASYELQGLVEFIQDHYGIDSGMVDKKIGSELTQLINELKN